MYSYLFTWYVHAEGLDWFCPYIQLEDKFLSLIPFLSRFTRLKGILWTMITTNCIWPNKVYNNTLFKTKCWNDLSLWLWPHWDPLTSPWPCSDSVTPLWLCCDPTVTSKWQHWDENPSKASTCQSQATPTLTCGPIRTFVCHPWGWSLHWGVWSAREHVSRHSLKQAHILSAFPPGLLLERPPSTCDLHHTWSVSSQLPHPFDHTLMSHVTTPCLGGENRASQVSGRQTHTYYDSMCVCVCVYVFMFVCVCQVQLQENGSCNLLLTLWPYTLWWVWPRLLPW